MNNIFSLATALSLATFVVSAGLLVFALRKKWKDAQPANFIELPLFEHSAHSQKDASHHLFFEKAKKLVITYRWGIFLGVVFMLLVVFAWIYAPPRFEKVSLNPQTPGRPLYNLRWGRDFIRINYNMLWSWGSLLTSTILLFLVAWVARKRSLLGAEFILLTASLNLAILGQWMLPVEEWKILGRNLYFVAIYGFLIWGWLTRRRLQMDADSEKTIKKSTEIIFLLALLILTASMRLYYLRSIPYGIEGDEAKWTSEAVNLGILGVSDVSGEYHRDALPVSFYLQVPLHRLIGPSLFAARLTVVILSIIGTLLFYWLLRQITIFPLAVLASLLLSVSIFDISASRLANVESFVKIMPILALALLAWAVRSQRWQIYGVSGIALALGMLTYDTVFPLIIIVLIIAIIELSKQKVPLLKKSESIAALLAPTILSLPLLIPYLSSRFSYYEFGKRGLHIETGATLWAYFLRVTSSWFIALHPDFLYNRLGPLTNANLLPFLVLGLSIALFHIKKRAVYWMLIWGALIIFPIPILTNSPVGRVYYPALPALYFFVGLGLFIFWTELDRFLGKNLRPLLFVVTLLPLVWLPFSNLYIYFNEVFDPLDRQLRREIGEFAAQMAGEETLILLPTIPDADTPLNNEYQMLELYMLQKIPAEKLDSSHKYIAPEDLLPEILSQKELYKKIEILIDENQTPEILNTLELCYSDGEITHGNFFTRFSLSENALEKRECVSASLNLEARGYNTLSWELENIETQEILVYCTRRATDLALLETEDFPMSHSWQIDTRFASDWTGTGFIMDNIDSAPFVFEVDDEFPEEGYIWVRYFLRATEETPSYLHIGEKEYPFADLESDDLHAWRWERIGPIDFAENTEFSLSHAGNPQYFMAIFIDSLVITNDIIFSPENNLWEDITPFSFLYNPPQSVGLVTLDLSKGIYQCQATTKTEFPIAGVTGENSLFSNIVEFDIE